MITLFRNIIPKANVMCSLTTGKRGWGWISVTPTNVALDHKIETVSELNYSMV